MAETRDILIPTTDEIVGINKALGYSVINRGNIDFLISKILSKYKDKDFRRQIAKIAAIIWMHLIQTHPFSDGNKRTASEVVQYFLKENNFRLSVIPNGIIYISLKIANNDITYDELIDWIYERLGK